MDLRKSISIVGDDARSYAPSLPLAGALAPRGDVLSLSLAGAGAATAVTALAMRASKQTEAVVESSVGDKISLFICVCAWYFLNIAFNIYNKKALLHFPFPWTVSLFQMAFGMLLFGPLWATGIRRPPRLSSSDVLTLMPAALGHAVTHGGAAVSFAAGAVSFTQIVKASEPVVSAILNYAFAGEVLALPVYAALLPIVGGVALASAGELSFTWLSFNMAMVSNIASASRAVYSKKVMGQSIGENMTSANFYAVICIMATLLLLPIAFFMEGPTAIIAGLKAAYATGGQQFLLHALYSGFFYYVYNEVAFFALSKLDAVSHAVANTMKRVGIIVIAVMVFNTPVTPIGIIGSSVAILGSLAYSLAKNTF